MAVHRNDRALWADAELLAAAAAGDGEAFAAFYRRHLAEVLAYLRRETGDRELAADLAAEVFAAVLLSAGRYQPQRDSALAWVIGIARHKLLMSWRRGRVQERARRRLGLEPLALDDLDLERVDQLADAGVGRLEEMLDGLPALEREAVRWRVVDELGYDQIAGRMGCSALVVRKRVSRGLRRLRDQLTEVSRA
ncbi:RNA polymerase sigma factor [Conexibacter sp. S30A1]|jgi:RNA polymerase sigma-70 factor (ECF subfamily)|uniref:RNA polymerase sigma factor n=1 Tax=Conexibacter sp. S30A1 TaxID=2937800 RepID=UPI00200FC53B|nr:RNA polymerase sigma factor [Conexibacter sp. S30A1]